MGGSLTGEESARAGRREELKAQNRAKLLAAAKKVFAEKGLGEATARDIVRETDLASGTFYNYFRDKDECFTALLEEFQQRTREATADVARDPALSLQERVEVGARAFFDLVVEERDLFLVLRRNADVLAAAPAGELFAPGMDDFAEHLELWSREGNLPGIDLDYLAATVAGAAFQLAIELVERDPPDPALAARFLSATVLGTVRALVENPQLTVLDRPA